MPMEESPDSVTTNTSSLLVDLSQDLGGSDLDTFLRLGYSFLSLHTSS